MFVIPEETIEVAHIGISERLGDLTDLLLREKPEQRERELQSHLHLMRANILTVPGGVVPLELSQLNPDLGSDHTRAESRMTMLGLDKVIDELYGIVERCATRVTGWQPSAVLDLRDDFAFDGAKCCDQTSGHADSLKATSQQSPQGALGIASQRDCILRQIASVDGLIREPRLLRCWRSESF
jgi:hypothetical protein